MGRKSSITQLDNRIRDAVDGAVRDGRATIDEIVAMIQDMGGQASRSAVGRYVANANRAMERYRQAQALARTWAEKVPENGDVAQLTRQMMNTAAQIAASTLMEGEDVSGKELALLARAQKDIALATKTDAEARARIRAEMAAELAERVEEQAKGKAMTPAAIKQLIKEAYGV